MRTLNIKQILDGKTYPDAGLNLYSLLSPLMDGDDIILLDMNEVNALPSMFLNPSIGMLITEYGVDTIKSKIKYTNISKMIAMRLQSYFDSYTQN